MASEPFVTLPTIGANPNHVGPVTSDGFVCITEAAGLAVSARSEVLQVEIQNYRLFAAPVAKRKPFAIVLHRLEIRSPRPYF